MLLHTRHEVLPKRGLLMTCTAAALKRRADEVEQKHAFIHLWGMWAEGGLSKYRLVRRVLIRHLFHSFCTFGSF